MKCHHEISEKISHRMIKGGPDGQTGVLTPDRSDRIGEILKDRLSGREGLGGRQGERQIGCFFAVCWMLRLGPRGVMCRQTVGIGPTPIAGFVVGEIRG